ncbi:MAG: hypothetical protein H0U44_05535 [Flavisolibacter sp.]|jgi:hypothetical protein|nr:hypothetical protein [Flavisolibacter sp.]
MIKRKLSNGDLFLLIANILPVYGVWFQQWDPNQVFLVYCMETVIIGAFTLLKLFIQTLAKRTDLWENQGATKYVSGVFFMFFFLLHYGMFVAIQTTMFLKLSPVSKDTTLLDLILNPGLYLGANGILMLSAFIFGYGYENMTGFIMKNEYQTKPMMRVMFEPYPRIFIQQFTVIFGAFFLMFGAGKVFILVFAAVKTWFTIFIDYEAVMRKAKFADPVTQDSKSSHS